MRKWLYFTLRRFVSITKVIIYFVQEPSFQTHFTLAFKNFFPNDNVKLKVITDKEVHDDENNNRKWCSSKRWWGLGITTWSGVWGFFNWRGEWQFVWMWRDYSGCCFLRFSNCWFWKPKNEVHYINIILHSRRQKGECRKQWSDYSLSEGEITSRQESNIYGPY